MDDYLVFAKQLARQAGQMIKDGFEGDLNVELKSDHSPVTQIDKAINDLVIKSVKEQFPEHGVLGEEADSGSGDEELQWLCDPLDGTKAFVIGVPVTTFILGLTKDGEVLISVVYNPFNNRLYHAIKGSGAFCDDQQIHVNDASLDAGAIVTLSESSFQFSDAIHTAGGQTELLPGAGYRAMLVATGRTSANIQGRADNHDIGPASLIVEEAGGKVSDLNGNPIKYYAALKNGVILSNTAIHEALLHLEA